MYILGTFMTVLLNLKKRPHKNHIIFDSDYDYDVNVKRGLDDWKCKTGTFTLKILLTNTRNKFFGVVTR